MINVIDHDDESSRSYSKRHMREASTKPPGTCSPCSDIYRRLPKGSLPSHYDSGYTYLDDSKRSRAGVRKSPRVVGLFLVGHLSKAKQAPRAQLNSSPMSSTWVYLDDRGSWQHFDSGASCVALMHAIHRWPSLLLCMVGARVLVTLRSNAVTTFRHHASCGISYYGCAGTLHSSIYASF